MRKSTGVRKAWCRISRAMSNPFMFGIMTSRTTRSRSGTSLSPLAPIGREGDLEAGLAKGLPKDLRQIGLVLHDQDSRLARNRLPSPMERVRDRSRHVEEDRGRPGLGRGGLHRGLVTPIRLRVGDDAAGNAFSERLNAFPAAVRFERGLLSYVPMRLSTLALLAASSAAPGQAPFSALEAERQAFGGRASIAANRQRLEEARRTAFASGAYPATRLDLGSNVFNQTDLNGSADLLVYQPLDVFARDAPCADRGTRRSRSRSPRSGKGRSTCSRRCSSRTRTWAPPSVCSTRRGCSGSSPSRSASPPPSGWTRGTCRRSRPPGPRWRSSGPTGSWRIGRPPSRRRGSASRRRSARTRSRPGGASRPWRRPPIRPAIRRRAAPSS